MLPASVVKAILISLFCFLVYWLLSLATIFPSPSDLLKIRFHKSLNKSVLLKEVNNIGELSVAEFYGEVFADINMVYDSLSLAILQQKKDIEDFDAYPYMRPYYAVFKSFHEKKQQYEKTKQQIKQHTVLLDTLQSNFKENANNFISKSHKTNEIEKIKQIQNELKRAKNQLPIQRLAHHLAEAKYNTMREKQNLVYLGRGSVKAYLDFNLLLDEHFNLQSTRSDSVAIQLNMPIQYKTIINPWFIEKKIKGFELFDQHGRHYSSVEIQAVKQMCIKKLLSKALQKGIHKKAEKSGLTTINLLFSYLGYHNIRFSFAAS